LKSEYVK